MAHCGTWPLNRHDRFEVVQNSAVMRCCYNVEVTGPFYELFFIFLLGIQNESAGGVRLPRLAHALTNTQASKQSGDPTA
jgi:hypothetical protein